MLIKAVVQRYRHFYLEAMEFLEALEEIPDLPVRFCHLAEDLYDQVFSLAENNRFHKLKLSTSEASVEIAASQKLHQL